MSSPEKRGWVELAFEEASGIACEKASDIIWEAASDLGKGDVSFV